MSTKILILSADAGKSYRTAAETVAEQFSRMNIVADIADALTLVPENSATLTGWKGSYSYHVLSRRDGNAYRTEALRAGKKLYRLCALGASALGTLLKEGAYDAVLCIHVYAGMMMTELRRRGVLNVPFCFLATEYTGEPGINEVEADGYCIPHRMLAGDFIRYDIPADRLFPTGIPIPPRFSPGHADRASLRREAGLPEKGRLVLVRAGNFEHPRAASRILALRDVLPDDTFLAVLCGINDRLLHQLTQCRNRERLFPFGYDVAPEKLLLASDICVGKPRGVATAEAMSCGIPLILFREMRGAESKNLDFLVRNGAADGSRSWGEILRAVPDLLARPEELARRSTAVRSFLPANAAEQVCRTVIRARTPGFPS